METVTIYWLAVKYFIQQNFTDWQAAKEYAETIVKGFKR